MMMKMMKMMMMKKKVMMKMVMNLVGRQPVRAGMLGMAPK